jgi:predicted RNA methylase
VPFPRIPQFCCANATHRPKRADLLATIVDRELLVAGTAGRKGHNHGDRTLHRRRRRPLFSALGLVFDLDPSSPGPGHWVPARKIYTVDDDGLRQPWSGLVFMNPPFGGRTVARIDVEQLNNMFEALAEFEGLCSRLSAVRMTSLEKKRLEVLNAHRQKRIADGDSDFATLNNEFHEAIYLGAHNPSIASVTRNFRQRLAPFRALQFVPGRTEYSFHEHDEIVRAIVSSDGELAYGVMRDHVIGTGLQVIEHFSRKRDVVSLQTAPPSAPAIRPRTRSRRAPR